MKINWGVIGCGGIAFRRTIPGLVLSENSNLVAVMDTNFDAAKTVQKEFDAKYAFDNIEELLALSEIEAVYIASPVFCHKEQAVAAADAGKHILIEKPVGLTSEEAEEIAAYCESKGIKLGVGFMMRFHAYHQKMREIVQSGKIGEVIALDSSIHVRCGEGVIALDIVVPEGKGRMNARDFINGRKIAVGDILG